MSVSAQEGSPATYHDEFSMVLGGPLFQLICKSRLGDAALHLLRRRVIFATMISWAPLLVLSLMGGHVGAPLKVPFVSDIEVHARFLLALPLLIIAELVVHQRTRPVVRHFIDRGLIPGAFRGRFNASIDSALRLRNSVTAEVALLVLVYAVGMIFIRPRYVALDEPTWYSMPDATGQHLTLAGSWYVYVSLPLFQFMLLRWYFRIFIWIRFLWHVSRIPLSLVPTHPDRVAGLGFLSHTPVAFAPLLAAHGVVLAGFIASQIFFHGMGLLDFKFELIAVVLFLLLLVLAPLLLFVPDLAAAKRIGLREYGTLAQKYVREFDSKWLRGGSPAGEPLLGSSDIQSLADMGNCFEFVRSIKILPVTREGLVALVAITLVPVAPLLLTMVPLDELINRLLKVVL